MAADVDQINERLIRIEEQVKGLDRHMASAAALTTIVADVDRRVIRVESDVADHERRIKAGEDDKTWQTRAVWGALIAAGMSALLQLQAFLSK